MLQFAPGTRLQTGTAHKKVRETSVDLKRGGGTKPSYNMERKKAPLGSLKTAGTRVFLTQDESPYFEDTTMATEKKGDFDSFPKGHDSISDKRIKNILKKLDSTVDKLNNAWNTCDKTLNRTSSEFMKKSVGNNSTFGLTEPMFGSNSYYSSTAKSTYVQNFLSMTGSDFFNPEVTMKINQVAKSLDMNPKGHQIEGFLWDKVNEGRDYFNMIKDEIRKKRDQLKMLEEKEDMCDLLADNESLEERICNLEADIGRAEGDIEVAEWHAEQLNTMIFVRRQDLLLFQKRFTEDFAPFVKFEKQLFKNVDELVSMEKLFEKFMIEMGTVAETSKENRKLLKRIQDEAKSQQKKEKKFEENIEIEKFYNKKRKQFIIKTKKEVECEKQREKEKKEQEEKKTLFELLEQKKEFEEHFDQLSVVSKQYWDKMEYVTHFDNLKQNNEELESKVIALSEEINLKKKIDLPTLQAELNEVKANKPPTHEFLEDKILAEELHEKQKRNDNFERTLNSKQNMTTNLMRGVMTIFNRMSVVKDYLNLEKMDEVKLTPANLGDVLLFCGEVLEVLNKNQQDPVEVRSQPLSFASIPDDE